MLDRVLRGEHEERLRQQVGGVGDRDPALLHRLQQRALCLRGGAIDLVGEHQVREQRARFEAQRLASPLSCASTVVPVMSAGMRSGVNWIRRG